MEQEDIDYILSHKKAPSNAWYLIDKYMVLLAPIVFLSVGLIPLLLPPKLDIYKILLCLIAILFSIWLSRLLVMSIKLSLKFHEIDNVYNKEQNTAIVLDVLKKYRRIKFVNESQNIIKARTRITPFSWGEDITLIALDGKILLNSDTESHFAISLNRKNIRELTSMLNDVKAPPVTPYIIQ